MLANEAQIDSSQQGLYVWYNNALAYPTYGPLIPSQLKQQLTLAGVPGMQSLAIAQGLRYYKSRVKLMPGAHAKGLIRIAGIHKQQGRFPNAEEAAEISIDLDFSNNYSLLLDPDSGKIFISFQAGDAKRIELTPRVKVNKIDWLCKTNLKRSVLPNDTQQSLN